MIRRWSWVALAILGGLFFVATALSGAWAVGLAVSDGGSWGVLTALVPVGFGLLFWRWITLGARLRAHPPLDPDTGRPLREPEEVGPWGVVGRVLLGLMVVGFVAVGVWGATLERRSTKEAETVLERADRTVRRQGLTAADVADAQQAHRDWLVAPVGPDPYDDLLSVPGGRVVQLSTQNEGAAILLRAGEDPPCVVVTIDRNDLVRSRLTDDCPS